MMVWGEVWVVMGEGYGGRDLPSGIRDQEERRRGRLQVGPTGWGTPRFEDSSWA